MQAIVLAKESWLYPKPSAGVLAMNWGWRRMDKRSPRKQHIFVTDKISRKPK
jgi:hypothetical protein